MSRELFAQPEPETIEKITSIWEAELGELEVPPDKHAIHVAGILYEGVEEKYGPASSNPLSYHGPTHSLDVLRRNFIIWRECHKQIPEKFPLKDLGLLAILGPGHDHEQLETIPGRNEQVSYTNTAKAMDTRRRVYTHEDKMRIQGATLVTRVTRNEDGQILQTYLREGERDPLKLTTAYADINGIAMEGVDRMLKDATNLFMEIFGIKRSAEIALHLDQYVDFLGSQAFFLNTRLEALPGDVAYYFPESEDAVKVAFVMAELFKPKDLAFKVAEFMQKSGICRVVLQNMSLGKLETVNSLVEHLEDEIGIQYRNETSS